MDQGRIGVVKKRKKKSWKLFKMKKFILYVLLFLAIIGLIYSSYCIICWFIDNQETKKQIQQLQELVEVDSNLDSSESILSVDFSSLLKKNKEVKGWIKVFNTNINYPFVQHTNNSYYLNHSFDMSQNNAGWIFLDYRNNIDELDTNTIIYGHGRVDGTMFGSLKKILTEEWLNDSNNYTINIYLPSTTYVFKIFSAYHVDTTDDYLKTSFNSVREYGEFLKMIKNRSSYLFPSDVNVDDKIITLSTCYNDREKMVVHGVLVSEE